MTVTLLATQHDEPGTITATVALAPGATESPALIPFSGPTRKVLELTFRTALRLGHNHIGTEHLLLALLEAEDGTGPLHRAGLDFESAEGDLAAALAAIATNPTGDTAESGQ